MEPDANECVPWDTAINTCIKLQVYTSNVLHTFLQRFPELVSLLSSVLSTRIYASIITLRIYAHRTKCRENGSRSQRWTAFERATCQVSGISVHLFTVAKM